MLKSIILWIGMSIPIIAYGQCKQEFKSTDPGTFVAANGITDGFQADGFPDGVFTSYLAPQSYIELNYPFVRQGGEICIEVAYFSANSEFELDLNGTVIPVSNPGGTNFPQSLEICIPTTVTGPQSLRLTTLAGFVFMDGSSSSYCAECDPAIPDTDGDQICDILDQCPLSATGDSDFDGVCDDQDNCAAGNDFFDLDQDGIPFFCDSFIDTDQNGIEDNQQPGFPLTLTFSHTRGYYSSQFKLEMAALGPNVQLRYTLDNQKPSIANGLIYYGPILIRNNTTVRVMAYNYTDTTEIIAHSYLFPRDVVKQTNMSNHITRDSVYGPQLKTALAALPVLSIVSNQIFPSSNIIQETEVSVEMFWPDSSRKGFMLHSGVETWGGSVINPKKHYRLEFKEQYGAKNLDYDVFESDGYDATTYAIKPVKKFKRLLLRAGSQDGLNGEFGNEIHAQFIRNRVLFDSFLEMGYPAPHGRFVHLFVNGIYEGQFHLMERPDEHFLKSYYGDESSNYEIYKNGKFPNGNQNIFDTLNQLIDVSNEADALLAAKTIDLDQTAAYLLMMSYASGFDWNKNTNCLGFGSKGLPYKFMPWDMDFSLGNGGIYGTTGSYDPTYFEAPARVGPVPTALQNTLYFNYKMADQLACNCYNNGALTSNFIDSIYRYRADQVRTSLITESARWGDYDYTNPFAQNVPEWNVNEEFETEFNRIVTTYIPARTNHLIQHWKTNGYTPNIDPVSYNQLGGEADSMFQLVLSHIDATLLIFYTLDGNDPRTFAGDISPSAQLYTGPVSLPNGVITVKARALDSTKTLNTINKWSAMCPRTFYQNIDYDAIVINEVMYHPNSNCSLADSTEIPYIELTNTSDEPIDLSNCTFTKGFTYTFPSPAVLNPDDFMVLCEDSIEFRAFYGFAPYGEFLGRISKGGEQLELSNPFGEVIETLRFDNAHPWDKAPDGNGFSLELLHPESDNTNPFNWFRSDLSCGTPGQPNSRICAQTAPSIVINEINYNSDNQNFDPGDWIELYNPDTVAIALEGWTFYDDNNSFTFPDSATLAPNAFLVLVEDSLAFRSAFPEVRNFLGSFQFGLNDKGERLSLFTPEKCLSDYVIYNDGNDWPIEANGSGPSLSLNDPFSDNAIHSSWSASSTINVPYGTPGRANEPCPSFVVSAPDTVSQSTPVLLTATSDSLARYEWFTANGLPLFVLGDSVWISFNNAGLASVEVTRYYFECEETQTIHLQVQACGSLDITVLLEGAYDPATQLLRTDLNTGRKVLPGMTLNPISGQPYDQPPYLYMGTEGIGWTDASYPSTAVDWVLVSLRTDPSKASETHQLAGLLHSDGHISWTENCVLPWTLKDDYYLLVEHRNHVGGMTPIAVAPVNRQYVWDFSLSNSYAGTGFGQVNLGNGTWGLIAGDGAQLTDVVSYDINSADNAKWQVSNGLFNRYLPEDHNMDGDVNAGDRVLWFRNNGKFSNVEK